MIIAFLHQFLFRFAHIFFFFFHSPCAFIPLALQTFLQGSFPSIGSVSLKSSFNECLLVVHALNSFLSGHSYFAFIFYYNIIQTYFRDSIISRSPQ